MQDHWEMADVYKALMAVAAGIILGLEREMKDKVAGLKTITIICLGAALFGILSYRIGGVANPTTIAAYVVSGVGFIGAGAIFKDEFSISGLTTAGIIWLAAAVGLSIGFGEYFLALTFIAASLIIIFITPYINWISGTKKPNRQLLIVIPKSKPAYIESFINELKEAGIHAEEKKIQLKESHLEVLLEITMPEGKVKWLQQHLLRNEVLISFSL